MGQAHRVAAPRGGTGTLAPWYHPSIRLCGITGLSAAIDAALAGGHRLVTLVGEPGVGKSALAAAWLDAQATPGARVAAAELRDEDELVAAVARAFGDGAALPAALDERLLVIDDFDRLVECCAPLIHRWVGEARRAAGIVVTSREPIGLGAEHILTVPPLAPNDALELVVALARRASPGLDEDDPALAEVVDLLDGNPLAIEIAASELVVLSPETLAARLRCGEIELRSDRRDRPARHRSLAAAARWSIDRLSPELAATLAQAAVFGAARFDVHAAEAVLGPDAATSLGALVRRSLLRRDRGRGEPELTVPVAVRAALGDQPIPELLEERFIGYVARLAARLGREARGDRRADALRAIERARPHLLAAFDRAQRRPDWRAPLAISLALRLVGPGGDASFEARDLLAAAVAKMDPTSPDSLVIDGLVAHATAAQLAGRRLAPADGRRLAAAMVAARRRGDQGALARLHAVAGRQHLEAGELSAARRRLASAKRNAIAAGDHAAEGIARGELAVVDIAHGDLSAAEGELRAAAAALRSAADIHAAILVELRLAMLHLQMRRTDGMAMLRRVIGDLERVGDRVSAARGRSVLGAALVDAGEVDAGREQLVTALDELVASGAARYAAPTESDLALIHHHKGELPRAIELYERSLRRFRDAGVARGVALVGALVAGAYAERDVIPLAEERLQEAEDLLATVGDPLFEAVCDLQRGQLELARARAASADGDDERARVLREQAGRRLAVAEGAHTTGVPVFEQSEDVRAAARLLRARLTAESPAAGSGELVYERAKHQLRHPFGSISFQRRRVLRGLIAALLESAGQPVAAAELATRALGVRSYEPERHNGTLRVNIARLRELVAPAGLGVEAADGGYRLTMPANVTVVMRDADRRHSRM